MTPERLREIRESLCLPRRALARLVGRNETSLREMEAGQRAIPDELGAWMDKLGQWIERNPPPKSKR